MLDKDGKDISDLVAVFVAPPLTEPFELTLARAVDLKNNGVNVKVVYCDGVRSGCVANPFKLPMLCAHCRKVRVKAIREYFEEHETAPIEKFHPVLDRKIENNEKLNDYRDEIWKGVVSTILTFYRVDIEELNLFDLRNAMFKLMANNLYAYSDYMFQCMAGYLDCPANLRVEFFNGRIVPGKAYLCAAVDRRVNYSIIEVSGHNKPIFLTNNASVHDLDYLIFRLKTYVDNGLCKRKLGDKFFLSRRDGVETDAVSFIKAQKKGLYDGYDGKIIVSIFTSSPDEMEVVGEQWFTEASKDPVGFIKKLRELLPNKYHLVVRMHPNQHGDRTGKTSTMIAGIDAIDGVQLIRPLDKRSTYELIDISDYVLTFGSTVGLEATYWGTPSFLAGRALWEDSDVAYITRTPDDVVSFVSAEVTPKSKDNAIVVGSYYMDSKDTSGALSWGDEGKGGYYVYGKNYLSEKRNNVAYIANSAIDKFLRKKLF